MNDRWWWILQVDFSLPYHGTDFYYSWSCWSYFLEVFFYSLTSRENKHKYTKLYSSWPLTENAKRSTYCKQKKCKFCSVLGCLLDDAFHHRYSNKMQFTLFTWMIVVFSFFHNTIFWTIIITLPVRVSVLPFCIISIVATRKYG